MSAGPASRLAPGAGREGAETVARRWMRCRSPGVALTPLSALHSSPKARTTSFGPRAAGNSSYTSATSHARAGSVSSGMRVSPSFHGGVRKAHPTTSPSRSTVAKYTGCPDGGAPATSEPAT